MVAVVAEATVTVTGSRTLKIFWKLGAGATLVLYLKVSTVNVDATFFYRRFEYDFRFDRSLTCFTVGKL